ncbi:MAG: hypothetical protein H0X62_00275, partial [Bacteroidetes bacterium]|nr:hypothetical protein [Bacteroidota bacterium]
MVKKIILGIITAFFLVGLLLGFLHFRQLKTPALDALYSIPASAAVILRSNDTESLIAKIQDGNLIWDELISLDYFKSLDEGLLFIDSLIERNPGILEVAREKPLYLSLHKLGGGRAEYLLSLSFPPSASASSINRIIQDAAKGASISTRNYDNATITSLKFPEKSFHYAFYKNILMFSPSAMLLENSVSQANSTENITSSQAFSRVFETANDRVVANLFINYQNTFPIISSFLGNQSEEIVAPFGGFANWAALDVSVKPNSL